MTVKWMEYKRLDPKATVIMCSAIGQQSMYRDAIQAGEKDFLIKPLSPALKISLSTSHDKIYKLKP